MARRFETKDGRTLWLRPAVAQDAPALIAAVDKVAREMVFFLRSSFSLDEERERAFITEAEELGNLVLVATMAGKLVGWATLLRGRPEFLGHTAVLGMGVLRGFRGMGIGTALLAYTLEWASNQGIEKVNLGVRASNTRAIALYHKHGFVQEGCQARQVKDPSGRYDDDIQMAYFVPRAIAPSKEGLHRGDGARTP